MEIVVESTEAVRDKGLLVLQLSSFDEDTLLIVPVVLRLSAGEEVPLTRLGEEG